jgi:hypothetical protein
MAKRAMQMGEKTAIFSQLVTIPKGLILLQNRGLSGLPFFVYEMTVLVTHFLCYSNA